MTIRKIALIVVISLIEVLVAVLAVETVLRLTNFDYGASKYPFGPIAFLKGEKTVFEPHGDAITYVPNMSARSAHVFYSQSEYIIDFDYKFRTNNLGLVQSQDVFAGRKSVLVLGDSFTEGVGAQPWFNSLAPEIEKLGYQPINGGLRGTGFHEWWQLTRYLQDKGLQIEKLVIVFTSPDYTAPILSFSQGYLRCLSEAELQNCDVRKYFFLPLPPIEQFPLWVDQVRTKRAENSDAPPVSIILPGKVEIGKAIIKTFFPASYHLYTVLRNSVSPAQIEMTAKGQQLESLSKAAIREFIEKFGANNIIYVHLPQKNEKSPSYLGVKARQTIAKFGKPLLFDGFELCGLTPSDYYANDGHPNEEGYKKISTCVMRAVTQLVQPEHTSGAR